jgi:hypothetical protein
VQIRASILRSEAVPANIASSVVADQQSPTGCYDRFMWQLADIKARIGIPGSAQELPSMCELNALQQDCCSLEAALEQCSFGYNPRTPGLLFSCTDRPATRNKRPESTGEAAAYTHVLAARLLAASMNLQVLTAALCMQPTAPIWTARLRGCRQRIDALQLEICQMIATLLGVHADFDAMVCGQISTVSTAHAPVSPMVATMLAWPLMVALNIESRLPVIRLWLQSTLQTIARVLGLRMLNTVPDLPSGTSGVLP